MEVRGSTGHMGVHLYLMGRTVPITPLANHRRRPPWVMHVRHVSASTRPVRGLSLALPQELGLQERAPMAPREASQTIAWWQERQNELRVKLAERREGQVGQGRAGGSSFLH